MSATAMCSFCLRTNREVAYLIAAGVDSGIYICEDCARDCIRMIEEDKRDSELKDEKEITDAAVY